MQKLEPYDDEDIIDSSEPIDESLLVEPVAVETVVEKIEVPELTEELLVDGAEPGVEINSASDAEPEEIELEAYSEDIELLDEDLEEIEII
jgi:hypothetical protein